MSNPKDLADQFCPQSNDDGGNQLIDREMIEYINSMVADTSGQSSKVLIGKALIPKGQTADMTGVDVVPSGYLANQLVLVPTGTNPAPAQIPMNGDQPSLRSCNPAEYIEGKMYIIDSECVSTPFHGMSFYLGKPDNANIDGGTNETIVSFEPDSDGDSELHVGGVLWVQDFNLNHPTLAKITLQGKDYTAAVTPEKHVGLIFHSPDEATVFSAQGTTKVALAYLPEPEKIAQGELKTFPLNDREDSQSNLSCNVGQINQPITYSHIPKEMLENFLVISFVVILTVTRKMGTVTRHSEYPKKG